MGSQGDAVGLLAAFVLLSACCALPTPQTGDTVSLVSEDSPSDNLWFRALEEDRPDNEQVIKDADMGEALPSAEEETSGVPGERNTVVGQKDSEGITKDAETENPNPRDPDETRNPYGEMASQMLSQKHSEEELKKMHRRYVQLKYYGMSEEEEDAVKEAVTASQAMAGSETPNSELEDVATAANARLIAAVKARRKAEGEGKQHFATKDFQFPADEADENGAGPFSRMYKQSLIMQQQDDASKKMMAGLVAKKIPTSLKRALEPNEKKREQEQSTENVYFAHKVSADNVEPKGSKRYSQSKKEEKKQEKLMELLHEAARAYKVRKLNEPNLKYEDVVRGTSIQGITNYFAMSPDEMERESQKFKLMSDGLNQQEQNLDKMEEDYIQRYDKESRMVPFEEWQKNWNMERMVNAEVQDPDNPVTEKMIKEDAAKLYQEHFHPDLEGAVKALQDIRRKQQQEYDENVASLVADAPTDADIEKLRHEKIVGAKELKEDTKLANQKLEEETAHPNHFGPEKKLNASATPDYKRSDHEVALKESQALVKKNYKGLLKDAERLKETGHRTDLMVLDHDTKNALAGRPIDNAAERHAVKTEQRFYSALKSQFGNETMQDMKKGVEVQMAKSMKAWNKVKKVVTNGGASIKYGAEMLESVPTDESDPQLEGDNALWPNGDTSSDDAIPLRMDDSPDNGMQNLPEDSKSDVKISVQMEASAERPRTGYADDSEDTPSSDPKTPEQVADEMNKKELQKADKEASDVEGDTPKDITKMTSKATPTDSAAEKQLEAADKMESDIESDADTAKTAKELDVPKMPSAETTQDDGPEAAAAAQEISAASAGSVSRSDEDGGSSQSTEDGIPIR